MIKYDAYFKQDGNGYFDIEFDATPLQEDWKQNIFDIISCTLASDKRLPSYLQNTNHINARGGSPCDIVENTSGKYYGSLVNFYGISNDIQVNKIANIRGDIIQTLQELQDLQFFDAFEVDNAVVDSRNSFLLFNFSITTTQGVYKQAFSFKYGNS